MNSKTSRQSLSAALFGVLMLGTLPGCGGAERQTPAHNAEEGIRATGAAPADLKPKDVDAPGSRPVSGSHFELRVPSSFQIKASKPPAKGEKYRYEPTGDLGSSPLSVMVISEPKPASNAEEQSYLVEEMNRGGDEADTRIERSRVDWPGAQYAVITKISRPAGFGPEQGAIATGAPGQRMGLYQIAAQVNDELLVGVIIYGPEAQLETSGLMDTLRSFRPKA